jgi:hypothetical protein
MVRKDINTENAGSAEGQQKCGLNSALVFLSDLRALRVEVFS